MLRKRKRKSKVEEDEYEVELQLIRIEERIARIPVLTVLVTMAVMS